jgi:hypothetical protein
MLLCSLIFIIMLLCLCITADVDALTTNINYRSGDINGRTQRVNRCVNNNNNNNNNESSASRGLHISTAFSW